MTTFWEVSKSAKIWLSESIFYVKNHRNLSHFFLLKNTNLGAYFLLLTFFDSINFLVTLLLKWCPNSYCSPQHQLSKFNNFLWVCWFLGKNLSNFVPPARKLDNPYYHNTEFCQFSKDKAGSFHRTISGTKTCLHVATLHFFKSGLSGCKKKICKVTLRFAKEKILLKVASLSLFCNVEIYILLSSNQFVW